MTKEHPETFNLDDCKTPDFSDAYQKIMRFYNPVLKDIEFPHIDDGLIDKLARHAVYDALYPHVFRNIYDKIRTEHITHQDIIDKLNKLDELFVGEDRRAYRGRDPLQEFNRLRYPGFSADFDARLRMHKIPIGSVLFDLGYGSHRSADMMSKFKYIKNLSRRRMKVLLRKHPLLISDQLRSGWFVVNPATFIELTSLYPGMFRGVRLDSEYSCHEAKG